MFGFGSRRTHRATTTTEPHTAGRPRRHFFRKRVNPDQRAAGLKAALANPNTTREGRQEAKMELHSMGRSAHVPLSTRIKRTLGIRSTPRAQRKRAARRQRL
ncbi:SubName: Full=Uncharacterized protein {ECO:0000313/EMBL:CCA67445.1} [Serendipita indica DSM 11827]|uniref:Uncharacterized protein n=1 Tax=Serendipita indica (strain DSM 11827) TaxID=1109443 RepID=G4T7Z3_SERID|nr:SubName: Full=Uncharacterized protein {ECO:0000313/EMBL:CCA67445.1} [Serendipita indica DSM 11827]CCA67445.1 hypothetical protein PIIN_01276 [Serendipita indica DSM 11827]